MEEQINRGTNVARTLEGNSKHVLWLAEYRWYKWKYTQLAHTGGKFHSWKWKNHNFTGNIVRAPHESGLPGLRP